MCVWFLFGAQVERALAERGEAREGGEGGRGQPLGLVNDGGEAGESATKLDEMKEEIDVSRSMHAGGDFETDLSLVVFVVEVR